MNEKQPNEVSKCQVKAITRQNDCFEEMINKKQIKAVVYCLREE